METQELFLFPSVESALYHFTSLDLNSLTVLTHKAICCIIQNNPRG